MYIYALQVFLMKASCKYRNIQTAFFIYVGACMCVQSHLKALSDKMACSVAPYAGLQSPKK